MDKLVVGPDLVDALDYAAPIEATLEAIARARSVGIGKVTVALLDRPRHAEAGAAEPDGRSQIKLPIDGDVAGALMAIQPESEVDASTLLPPTSA